MRHLKLVLTKTGKRAARALHRLPGYTHTARQRRSEHVAICAYHGVVSQPLPFFNWCQLGLADFAKQIAFIAQEYRVLPLGYIIDCLQRGVRLPPKSVAITFDDGFRNVCTTAFPVLRRYQLPFTVFLVTGLVGTNKLIGPDRLFTALTQSEREAVEFAGRQWPLDTPDNRLKAFYYIGARLLTMKANDSDQALESLLDFLGSVNTPEAFELLNWDEVHQLARSGLADFGSHTHTHVILSRCDPACQQRELLLSRETLLQQLGKAELFAYPNGKRPDFNQVTKSLLRQLGYKCGLSTIPGLNLPATDIYELRRVNLGPEAIGKELELLMLGLEA